MQVLLRPPVLMRGRCKILGANTISKILALHVATPNDVTIDNGQVTTWFDRLGGNDLIQQSQGVLLDTNSVGNETVYVDNGSLDYATTAAGANNIFAVVEIDRVGLLNAVVKMGPPGDRSLRINDASGYRRPTNSSPGSNRVADAGDYQRDGEIRINNVIGSDVDVLTRHLVTATRGTMVEEVLGIGATFGSRHPFARFESFLLAGDLTNSEIQDIGQALLDRDFGQFSNLPAALPTNVFCNPVFDNPTFRGSTLR